MKKVESLNIKYIGYQSPDNEDEVALEILGLETAIATAQQRIAVLKQSLKLQSIIKASVKEEPKNAQIIPAPVDNTEAKQTS